MRHHRQSDRLYPIAARGENGRLWSNPTHGDHRVCKFEGSEVTSITAQQHAVCHIELPLLYSPCES
jgi:hypothetical protein